MLFTPELVERVDLRLAVTDDVVEDYPEFIRCREHNDKQRGNLAVYRSHIHCYVCGFHMAKTMQALAYLLKVELKDAAEKAERYTRASLDGYRARTTAEARRDPLPGSLATIYNGVLRGQRSHRLNWLYARGLNDNTIDAFWIGHDGMRFVIPLFDRNRQLVSLRFRKDEMYCEDSAAKYSGVKGRNGFYLYPEFPVAQQGFRELVVCEGEFDAIRLWQDNIPAVTSTNGAGQAPAVPAAVKEQFPWVEKLVIATDMDEPGRIAAEATAKAAQELGFACTILSWEEGKDVSEALQLGSLYPSMIRDYL